MKKILLMLILATLCAGAVFAEEKMEVFIDRPSRTVRIELDYKCKIVIDPKEEDVWLFSDGEPSYDGFTWSMMDDDGEVYEYSFLYADRYGVVKPDENGEEQSYLLKYQGETKENFRDWYVALLPSKNYKEVLNLLSEKNAFNAVFKDNKKDWLKYSYSMSYDNEWLKHCIHWVLTAEYFRGDKGPAGGTILYDCGADDDYGNGDGMLAYEKGWRYIEFADKYIHLIGKKPSCDAENDFYDKAKAEFQFLPEMDESLSTSASLFEGKENTDKILEAFKTMASKNNQNYPISSCAAKLCDELEYNGFDDWYLPSYYEVHNVYKLLGFDALPDNGHDSYGIWTSTREDGKLYFFANTCNYGRLSADRQIAQDVSTMNRILPFRRF